MDRSLDLYWWISGHILGVHCCFSPLLLSSECQMCILSQGCLNLSHIMDKAVWIWVISWIRLSLSHIMDKAVWMWVTSDIWLSGCQWWLKCVFVTRGTKHIMYVIVILFLFNTSRNSVPSACTRWPLCTVFLKPNVNLFGFCWVLNWHKRIVIADCLFECSVNVSAFFFAADVAVFCCRFYMHVNVVWTWVLKTICCRCSSFLVQGFICM